MNINQHNYEEFFLLYVDGELSATDKLAVEQFVQANPGLAIELEMLQQVQLADESIVFGDKNSLFRNEATEIGLNNYEEQFLLYVDNELNAVEKEKVETFVLQHPAVQDSFTLLKKTKLEAEQVLFPDKQSLYRKEEKERPVFYMRWQRIAVAAAILGFAVLTWTLLPDTKNAQQNIAGLVRPLTPATGKQTNTTNNNNTAPATLEQPAQNIASVTNTVIPDNTITTETTATVNNNPAEINTVIAKNEPPVTASVVTTREDIISTQASGGFDTKARSHTTSISGDNASVETAFAVKNNNPANDAAPVHAAVYKELDTDNEEKSLLLGSFEINKDKLRGFFRKAGSLFRSKSKTEDDKTESAPSSNTRSLE
jgi:hypothetical protein